MTAPVISFVGRSNSGKTTLIEKVIPALRRRGLRVATVKHDVHGFEMDHPGKDTWRHAQAGAEAVIIASPQKLALIRQLREELPLDEVLSYLPAVDLIITEGYKTGDKPKIEVFQAGHSDRLLTSVEQGLFAVAASGPLPVGVEPGVPVFDWNDVEGLCDLIVARFLR